MCEVAINHVNHNQHMMVSMESDMGRKCGVFRKFKDIFISNGFENYIWMDDDGSENLMMEVYNQVCSRRKVLGKNINNVLK